MNSFKANSNAADIGLGPSYSGKLQHGEFLFNEFTRLFDQYDQLAQIHQQYGNEQKLRILCYQLSDYPSLVETFRALCSNDEALLDKSLFCSWFSFLLADQLKLSVVDTKDLFIAGLAQELAKAGQAQLGDSPAGEVGGENNETNTLGQVTTADEVRRFLDSIPRLSEQLKVIVGSHHERLDGTGFPSGKVEHLFSLVEKVHVVANEVIELSGRYSATLYDFMPVLPILRLNASVYDRKIYCAAFKLLSAGQELHGGQESHDYEASEQRGTGQTARSNSDSYVHRNLSIQSLIDRQNSLLLVWPHLLTAAAEVSVLEDNLPVMALKQIARRAWILATTAGILSDDLLLWLTQVDNPAEVRSELAELDVLLDELDGIISTYQHKLETFTGLARNQLDEAKHAMLVRLCGDLKPPQETFDLEEFTILNMCD
ncbi:HD domain-containing phosphohydrolase [Alkalimarinus coralli]|uniref:HD domain-containing phosphohydrolase n=1 Tax=Alkalimarinus coralli TaxID=2935863 RepID=UPI00202B9930|nr:HD domain-containing phosphohydrolase [Alkalimarinus coralli]